MSATSVHANPDCTAHGAEQVLKLQIYRTYVVRQHSPCNTMVWQWNQLLAALVAS